MKVIYSTLIALLLFLIPTVSWAQVQASRRNHEIGFSIDTFGPAPNTELDSILRSSIGLSLFYRIYFQKSWQTELGVSHAFLRSRQTEKLLIIPIHLSLGYRVPLKSHLEIIPKLGFGSAYLEVRPKNVKGWDPFLLAGVEGSIRVTRSFRIGAGLDYIYIYEKHLDSPDESPPVPSHVDPRFQARRDFRTINSSFLRFGVQVGVLF